MCYDSADTIVQEKQNLMFRFIFATSAIITFSTSLLVAADWTAFRGPDGNGKSPDTGLLKQWDGEGPKLLWLIDSIGFGYSGVTVSSDRIYTSGNVERDGKVLTMIFCLDKDGKKIWEQDNGPAIQTVAHTYPRARNYPGTRGTPAVSGDRVYDTSGLGEVACYNAETGEKIWSRNLTTDYDAPLPTWCL